MDYGIYCDESSFWVIHKATRYGPFDYQFSYDMEGIEMYYQGQKFGEFCNAEQFCADLKPYKLPISVCQAATVVFGIWIMGITTGLSDEKRRDMLEAKLQVSGLKKFAERIVFDN
jgi:sulfur relay (sulfurtransferase) complex TusBCD TusD component (DsrE family)